MLSIVASSLVVGIIKAIPPYLFTMSLYVLGEERVLFVSLQSIPIMGLEFVPEAKAEIQTDNIMVKNISVFFIKQGDWLIMIQN